MTRCRTIPLVALLAGAATMTLRAGDPGPPGKVMTPDAAVDSRTSGAVTVEFRVGSVGLLTGIQGPGMPPDLMPIRLTAAAPLQGGGEFNVYVNGKLLEDLHRLALGPDHFKGALLQVTGALRRVEVGPAKRQDYEIVVLDLDKLRVMQRPWK
jgi:hypothetical protein